MTANTTQKRAVKMNDTTIFRRSFMFLMNGAIILMTSMKMPMIMIIFKIFLLFMIFVFFLLSESLKNQKPFLLEV